MTSWYIKARDNSTLLVKDAGIEADYESLQIVKRFNDVGTWALQLRKESSHYATFAPVNGAVPDVGLLVHVDNEDGNGPQLVLSGPMLDIDIKANADNTQVVTITGACDNYSLYARRALQVPHYPYIGFLSCFVNLGGPAGGGLSSSDNVYGINSGLMSFSELRYYPCLDTSGTTATDYSGNAQNGTYTGGFTLNQNSLVDDPNPCILLNGSTGYINVPTTGLITGNGSWSVWAWVMRSVASTANEVLWSFGSTPTKQGANIGSDSSGFPYIGVSNVAQSAGPNKIPLNQPVFLVMTWDGTTLAGYMNGILFNTQTPGALSITYGSAFIGKWLASTNFWNGNVAHAGYAQGLLTAAMVGQMYAVGVSRLSYENFDDNGGFWSYPNAPAADAPTPGPAFTYASTAMIYYVQRNAAPSASPVAGYGAAAPATTFTNAAGTHTARTISTLSIAADPSLGSSVYVPARMDVLLDLLGAIALQSNPELGFKLEQSGSNLVFTVYGISDLTSTAIFSRDLYGAKGNMLDYELKISRAKATHIFAGGANPGGGSVNLAERLWGEGENSAGISSSGYLEDLLDYRQASTGATLAQAITGQLNTDASIVNINATLLDQPGTLYFKGPAGKGYDLGNKVTVIADNQTLQYVIRQIQIDLQPGKPAVITPAIGTPIRAEIMSELDTIAQRIAALQAANITLKANY